MAAQVPVLILAKDPRPTNIGWSPRGAKAALWCNSALYVG